MRGPLVLAALSTVPACDAGAPPRTDEVAAWAKDARYRATRSGCAGIEERYFGAIGSTCWFARSTVEQSPGSRMFPRVEITIARYTSIAAAQARIATFRFIPPELAGEAEKTYPLRAGFRLGSQVVIVTTDAYAFEADAERVARQLARATGGTELTCWQTCRG